MVFGKTSTLSGNFTLTAAPSGATYRAGFSRMSPNISQYTPSAEADVQPQGLFRTTIAGPGRSLADAFANLDQSARVERVLRHPKRDLVSARVTLTPEEGHGYWELARIRNDLYIIQSNFTYKKPRFEFVPGDGL